MRSSTTTYELTDLQKQIWYGCLRFADPGAYTLSVCIRLDDVDTDIVRDAVERVVRADPLLALRVGGSPEEPLLEPVAHAVVDDGAEPGAGLVPGGQPGALGRLARARAENEKRAAGQGDALSKVQSRARLTP